MLDSQSQENSLPLKIPEAYPLKTKNRYSMLSIPIRLRRNRRTEAIRNMVQETELNAADLIAPFFVIEGENRSQPIHSLPGIERLSIDRLLVKIEELHRKGVQSIALFPVLENHLRTHVKHQMQHGNGADKAIKELIKVYTLSNK